MNEEELKSPQQWLEEFLSTNTEDSAVQLLDALAREMLVREEA